MTRTQIYLPEAHIKFFKRLAQASGTTMSEEIRKALNEVRSHKRRKMKIKKKVNPGEWLLKTAKETEKLANNAPRDLASNVDKYLYGDKAI